MRDVLSYLLMHTGSPGLGTIPLHGWHLGGRAEGTRPRVLGHPARETESPGLEALLPSASPQPGPLALTQLSFLT